MVQKLEAKVSQAIIIEEILDTLQFDINDSNNPYSPWDGLNSRTWLYNYSMALREVENPFGLDDTTAMRTWLIGAYHVPSTFNLPADSSSFATGPVQEYS